MKSTGARKAFPFVGLCLGCCIGLLWIRVTEVNWVTKGRTIYLHAIREFTNGHGNFMGQFVAADTVNGRETDIFETPPFLRHRLILVSNSDGIRVTVLAKLDQPLKTADTPQSPDAARLLQEAPRLLKRRVLGVDSWVINEFQMINGEYYWVAYVRYVVFHHALLIFLLGLPALWIFGKRLAMLGIDRVRKKVAPAWGDFGEMPDELKRGRPKAERPV